LLKPAIRRGLLAFGAFALALAVLVGLVVARIASGSTDAAALKPIVERVLASQVEGGKARVERVQVIRYQRDGALGLRLHGVTLDDGKGRPVLHARLVEAGLGADSIMAFAAAPSRLVLKDFFVATSVSPQGRYALGYDARGPPPPLDLELIFLSLTGEPRRDRPLSYIRRVNLRRGVVQFRQVGGPVAWKANIEHVAFEKAFGRLDAVSKLTIDDGVRTARVTGHANGDVGLKSLTAGGSLTGFTPARVFPAVSLTKGLSVLDAPVQGHARLQYALDRGITAADVSGSAGAGALRIGGFEQPLEGVDLVTRYDPASRQVLLQRFDLRAQRTHLDVTGHLWLVPEKAASPARVEYRFTSPKSAISLARTSEPQPLEDLAILGSITPQKRRLDVSDLTVRLAGAPVRMSLAVYGGADTRLSRGVKADIAVTGPMSIQTLYALWPEQLAPEPRRFVTQRLHSATVLGSTVHADIPPGQLDRKRLTNPMLRVAFRYAGGGVKVAPTLPGIEEAVGKGVVQGNRFDLTMATGRLGKLAISDAVVSVPRFLPGGAVASVRSRAQGDLGDMLRLVDSPPLSMMSSTSMSPDRFSGPADLVIDMRLPLRKGVTRADAKVNFAGQLHDLRIKDVTLGEDLHKGEMTTRGTLERVDAEGTARVGPYGGKIDFWMPLKGADAGRKHIELDGKVGVLPGSGAPFRTSINTRNGIGGAVVRSRLFEGEAQWRKGERMTANGIGEPAAWKQAGLPAGPGLPARVPVRLAMTANGTEWTGRLEADAYSGSLAYTRGNPRIIRYAAEITPAEATRIGVGELPMFKRAQPLTVAARVGHGTGSLDYAAGGLDGRFEWSPGGRAGVLAYRFSTTLDGNDLKGLGVPLALDTPVAVKTHGVGTGGGLTGEGEAAGAAVRYEISPEREGRRQIAFSGSASDRTFGRFGLDVTRMMDGPLDFSGRLTRTGDGGVTGRLVGDFDRTALRVPNSGWSKPAGKPAQGALDLALKDGTLTLRRITADGEGISVRGSGSVSRGGALSVALSTARLEGFFDGAVSARRDETRTEAVVNARYLDFRPILKEAQRLSGRANGGSGGAEPDVMRLDASIDRVRVTDSGYVNDVKLDGGWGALDQRRATLTAVSEGGGAIDIRMYPDKGATALSLQVADLGDIAKTLGGYDNLRGGATSGSGRIVPGGYDFDFEIRDITILRVPGAAQLVATNGAIRFDRMVAPLSIRGSKVTLGDVVATGPSVGLTAKGIMDTKTRTMDVVGVVTPAYGLNAALGGLFGAREGEGLFGITYRATGAFTAPNIAINPLSVIAPGVLRRMFEPRTPTHELEPPAP
jgi:hypothetical protein